MIGALTLEAEELGLSFPFSSRFQESFFSDIASAKAAAKLLLHHTPCCCREQLLQMIDDNQDTRVTIVRWTDFNVIVLYQLVKVPTLDVFRMKS